MKTQCREKKRRKAEWVACFPFPQELLGIQGLSHWDVNEWLHPDSQDGRNGEG